jgi:hypothetical protein
MIFFVPDNSGFKKGESDLHEVDDDAHDDEEERVRVYHQRLQLLVDVGQRRFVRRRVNVVKIGVRHFSKLPAEKMMEE